MSRLMVLAALMVSVLFVPGVSAWDDGPAAKPKLYPKAQEKHRKDGEGKDRPRKEGEPRKGEGEKRKGEHDKPRWEDVQKGAQEIWGKINKNFDNKITWEEAKEAAKKMDFKFSPEEFDKADENADGSLSKDEVMNFFRRRAGLGEGEKEAGKEERAKREEEERRKQEERKAQERKEHEEREKAGRKDGDKKEQEKKEAAHRAGEKARRHAEFQMKEYDENKDGKLSKEEWLEGDESFDEWDKSGDGYLSREELVEFFRAQILKKSGATEQE